MGKVPDRIVGPQQVASGPTTVFTAPAGGTLVRWVRVSNPTGSPVTFTLSVGTDGSGTRVYDAVSIPAGQPFYDYPYLELDESDILQASAGTNNVLVLTVGGDALAVPAPTGSPRVIGPFPIAFDTPNLENGVSIGYTPAVGDVILGGTIVTSVAWNGTSPRGDFGPFVDLTTGWLKQTGANPIFLDSFAATIDGGFIGSPGLGEFGDEIEITAARPVKVVVSQDGTAGGAAVGGTQGQSNLYIVAATPSAP